jgi:3-deoxy-D-manno-octulosonate 8-phosphate phosphatase (KDO 8-P phosphatase)
MAAFDLGFDVPDEVLERASRVRLVVFDVDGVLTDGSLFLGDDGQEYKAFHSRDGHGIKMLLATGVDVAIITGRTSKVVEHRVADLGIRFVYQGRLEKFSTYRQLVSDLGLDDTQTCFVGDDVVDLPIMLQVGLAITVNDGHPFVKQHAHWVTPTPGGRGAAREVCETIMYAQGNLDQSMLKYLSPGK